MIYQDLLRIFYFVTEQMLKQRSLQEEMVKDYSTRTTILTRQLQKTEEEYQNEIKKIMNVFDAEEKEYRRIIEYDTTWVYPGRQQLINSLLLCILFVDRCLFFRENQNHLNRLTQERQDEVNKNVCLQKEV